VQAGLYSGFNWQFAPNWISGFEGGASFGRDDGATVFTGTNGTKRRINNLASMSVSIDDKWDATIRARLGYIIPGTNSMIYAAGGLALLKETVAITLPSSFQSDLRAGYTIGGGLEAALAVNWTVRVEYLFSDYGRATYSNNLSMDTQTNTFRLGIARRVANQ
jgi:outer membrane immunogenic protein